jgi:hypothetical protein
MMNILAVQDEKNKMIRELEKMEKNKCLRKKRHVTQNDEVI